MVNNLLLWSIVGLNLWTWLVHGFVVTFYSEPNWLGDKTGLNVGDSSSYIAHQIQSVEIQIGYVFRVFRDRIDRANRWAMYYDINVNESNLSQLLFKIQSYMVVEEIINHRPNAGWIWIYNRSNYTGAKLAIACGSDSGLYEWNATNASIIVGKDVGVITYTNNGGYGTPATYVSDTTVIKPFMSFRANYIKYLPTQLLVNGHVWLFAKPNFQGDRTSIKLNALISHLVSETKLSSLGSIQIPPGMIVICYAASEFLGPATVWDWNVTDFEVLSLTTRSLKTASSNDLPAENYLIPFVEVIRPFSDIYPQNILPWRLPLGSESKGFESYTIWQAKSITIPKGLALIAYQDVSTGMYSVWLNSTVFEKNLSFSGFKVVREVDVLDWHDSDPNPNQVFIYAKNDYMNEHLVIEVNRDMSYWYYLYPHFGKRSREISSLKIPLGLKLIGYTLPYFNGYVYEYTMNTPSISQPLESFRVVSINDTSYRGSSKDSLVVVVQIYRQENEYIPVDTELMHLPLRMDGTIERFTIPNGYQVIGYTRPFFMGLNFSYTTTTKYDNSIQLSTNRIRSLQIVKESTNRILTQYSTMKRVDDFESAYTTTYYVSDAEPCISPWTVLNIPYSHGNSTVKIVSYNKCFYQGTPITENIINPTMTVKSYRILDATDDVDTAYSDYVALYGTWSTFDNETLSFRMNDEMPVLYSPWEANIKYIKMSTDVLVVAFSDSNYTGDCKWWTHSNATSGDGKMLINDSTWQLRSFKVLDRTEWRGHEACLERPNMHAHTTIQLTTASPVPLMTSATDDELEQGDAIKHHTSSVPPVETTTSTSLLFVGGQDVSSTSQDVGSSGVPSTKSVKTSISPRGSQLSTTNPVFKDNFVIQTTTEPVPQQQKQSKSLLEEWYSWIVLAVITTFAVVVVIKHRREDRNKQTPPLLDVQWHDLDLFRLTSQDIQLGDAIASGSSGIISLATFLGKTVAVKMLHPNDTERIQSFIDEIDLWTTFDSPYLVTLLGIAWTQPTDIMAVMEYMNMGDLRTYLSVTNPETFSWQNKLMCLNNIAHGLFYLHTSQQLHRDLKSRNVLLDSVNGTKLCDFGSSKDDAFGATMTAMVGTFRWMAPEMLLFQKYSYPVDMYSFGVVMSELDTHQVPYSDIKTDDGRLMSDESVTRMVLHEGLRPSFSPSCPLWYKSLSFQCMLKDPSERPKISEVLAGAMVALPTEFEMVLIYRLEGIDVLDVAYREITPTDY